MANGLRIIGVRILEGCPSYLRKVLQEGELYLLYNDYEGDPDNIYTLKKIDGEVSDTALHLYNQVDAEGHPIKVNVCAVVGKNGDGKSSLIEVVLRILNNFAFQVGFRVDQESLNMVENLRAILYYEIDDDLYAISSETEYSTVNFWKNGRAILNINQEWNDAKRKVYLKQYNLDVLFYTTVINYSIYSYNSQVFAGENEGQECWIDSLFHKNDEYQTPVVLNPMRTNGNININNEEYLSRQRLLSLLAKSLPNDEIRIISETQKAVGFKFSMEEESKLIKTSIRKYYNDIKNVHSPLSSFEEMHQLASTDLKEDKGIKSTLEYFEEFCKDFKDIFTRYSSFFAIASETIQKEEAPETTDLNTLAIYLTNFKDWKYTDDKQGYFQFFIDVFTDKDYKGFNYAFLYRLMVILKIWNVLKEEKTNFFNNEIDDALENRQEPKYAAQLYCCYKILSILTTYKPYIDHSHVYDSSISLLINSIGNNIGLRDLGDDVKDVLTQNDYRTLKLHQSLNYLDYISKFPDTIYYGAEKTVKVVIEGNVKAKDYGKSKQIIQYFVTLDQLNEYIKRYKEKVLSKEVVQYLPPPIFIGDIIIENDKRERFPYSSLSSGQLQKWNTVGALMYHLRNLNDEPQEATLIHYKHINVIFEEVELYFHPEYQREFVSYVLGMIHRSTLPNIESINICFVTHSPFILSDILRNNTLYLENGLPKTDKKEETFGANLYDLMVNSFFLYDNAMGKYSSDKIMRIISKFNEVGEVSEEEKSLIGDILIRNYLNGRKLL